MSVTAAVLTGHSSSLTCCTLTHYRKLTSSCTHTHPPSFPSDLLCGSETDNDVSQTSSKFNAMLFRQLNGTQAHFGVIISGGGAGFVSARLIHQQMLITGVFLDIYCSLCDVKCEVTKSAV